MKGRKKHFSASIFLLFFLLTVVSQNKFQLVGNKPMAAIPFTFKNNLILIPVEINKHKFTFIFDTGVSKTLLFNIKANDSVTLNNRQKVRLKGLGANDYYNGIKSTNNFIKINNVTNTNAEIYFIDSANFDFSSRIGENIHGLIGGDLIKDYFIEINYIKRKIKIYKPSSFKRKKIRKWQELPIEVVKNKPYVSLNIANRKKLNFLLDTGSSDAVWLMENSNIKVPVKNFDDYLGNGLSGEIHGKKAKLESFSFGKYTLSNVLVAFPEATFVNYEKDFFIRNGIIGGNILKRFHLLFDYHNKKLYIKKNANFKQPFNYNKTGIDVSYFGKVLVKEKKMDLLNSDTNGNKTVDIVSVINFSFKDSFIISNVKKGSSGEKAGLQKGDMLIKINGRTAYNFKLEQIVEKLSNNKRKVKLTIQRNGVEYDFVVPLINYL